jgi:hypothetical protein
MIYYVFLVIAVLGWGAHIAWRWKEAKAFAPQLLKARQEAGELPTSVSEAEFTELYLRSEGPRAASYQFVCGAFLTFALAPIAMLFNAVWEAFWILTGRSPVFETGTLVHTFMFFLFLMGLMIGLLAIAMHRYHTLAPPNLNQVIRNLQESHS